MSSDRKLEPSSLSLNDLPWQVRYSNDRCTLCGQCTAVCPVKAIELAVFRKRHIKTSVKKDQSHFEQYDTFYGIQQKTRVENACIGCAMCTMVCPNDAISPLKNPGLDRLKFHVNQQGVPRRRGGRRNASQSVLDRIKFIRIS
ncbi:MAG: 4Fe-4S binding protein, partial [Proteobacteria bacterium]|nr:4Fe-4S binding protein [Pseudomonadota bacterium]